MRKSAQRLILKILGETESEQKNIFWEWFSSFLGLLLHHFLLKIFCFKFVLNSTYAVVIYMYKLVSVALRQTVSNVMMKCRHDLHEGSCTSLCGIKMYKTKHEI